MTGSLAQSTVVADTVLIMYLGMVCHLLKSLHNTIGVFVTTLDRGKLAS